MYDIASAGVTLVKRVAEAEPTNWVLPSWAWLVFLLDAAVFLPMLLFIGYTLGFVYPVLAMVEDPSPPAYEPVSLNDDAESITEDNAVPPAERATAEALAEPVTASVRATNRLLYSVGGWRSNFRGLWCAFVLGLLTVTAGGIFGKYASFFGTLIASLALVQVSTALVHIVIGTPQKVSFWRRLPPLRKTFEATCFPVLAFWATTSLALQLPLLLSSVFGLPVLDPSKPKEIPAVDGTVSWKVAVILLITLAVQVLAVVPSHVLLVRVQASLLPPEEDTIIPFDRSFQGKVEPAIVGGKGYVSMKDALATFPRASWIRLYMLYAKTWVIGIICYGIIAAVVLPEIFLLPRKSE